MGRGLQELEGLVSKSAGMTCASGAWWSLIPRKVLRGRRNHHCGHVHSIDRRTRKKVCTPVHFFALFSCEKTPEVTERSSVFRALSIADGAWKWNSLRRSLESTPICSKWTHFLQRIRANSRMSLRFNSATYRLPLFRSPTRRLLIHQPNFTNFPNVNANFTQLLIEFVCDKKNSHTSVFTRMRHNYFHDGPLQWNLRVTHQGHCNASRESNHKLSSFWLWSQLQQ